MALPSSPLLSPALEPSTSSTPCRPAPPDPDPARLPAAAIGGDGGPVSPYLRCSGTLLPPPPAVLPPNFTPGHISDVLVVPTEPAWVEVGGRRRPRLEKMPAPPPRMESGLSPAFKRRTFGLCFRCLSPEHFVADCHGPVRCLGCRRPGHRERDCQTRHSGGQAPQLHPCPPPAPPSPSMDLLADQEHRPCSPSPPPQRSWASVVALPEAPRGPGDPATGVAPGLLQPLLAAKAEALSAELQAMFAARLEEVFLPLRDLVAAVQGWSEQVSGLWELMEAIGGALADFSAPGKHDDSASLIMPDGKEASAAIGAGCSSELSDVMAQRTEEPPDLGLVIPELGLQCVEEQDKVQKTVASCRRLELIETVLPDSSVGEAPLELVAASGPHSLKVSESDTSPTLLDELLNNFSCTAPLSLLDAPIHLQIEGDATCAGRRSGRLDKKNRTCNIPASKRAEYRLADSFGELPKDPISKKGTEEDVEEKTKAYLRLCKKPIAPTAIQAVRELVEANG
ncbi:unnamed protein product [Alopecurus aequalis]